MDITLTERNLVLVGHILGAIILLGPATMAASIFPRLALGHNRALCEQFHRITMRYGIATVVVPALGFYLAWRMDYLGLLWVQLSIGLFLGSFALLMIGILPRQRDLLEGDLAAVQRSDVASLRMMTGIYSLTWLVVLYLMVAKPS
jgi:hypothetical protein